MQEDTDDDADDEGLQFFVGGQQHEVEERSQRRHDGEDGEQCQDAPEAVAAGGHEGDEDERHGDVVQHDAVEESLVDVAVGVDEGHALEEGVQRESQEESPKGVAFVLVAGMGVLVEVAVLDVRGELLEECLDEESQRDGGGIFESEGGRGEAVEEDVGEEVDEAYGEEVGTAEDGDGTHQPRREAFADGLDHGPGHHSEEYQYICSDHSF